eukprot:7143438-Pyramimonas_sp.AAC.1
MPRASRLDSGACLWPGVRSSSWLRTCNWSHAWLTASPQRHAHLPIALSPPAGRSHVAPASVTVSTETAHGITA